MKYEFRSGKETASTTGQVDPRDIITNEDADDQEEDLAWSIAGAYAFLQDEQEDD